MENKTLTAVEQLIELIPSGAEIKTAIFEGNMDEKMLDEWLWERIFRGKDFLSLQKQQIIDAYMDFYCGDPKRREDAEDYYTTKYGKQ